MNLEMLINGEPLSNFHAEALLNYTIGETPLEQDVFQGINRTDWNLLKSRFGLRTITVTILFRGEDLHEAKVFRSIFNSKLTGKVLLFFFGDGFYYDCYCTSLGAEELVGIGEKEAAVKSKYVFSGIRRDKLKTETCNAGDTINCLSTMPYTDCKLTVQLPADPHLPTLELSGSSINFDNSSGYYIADPLTANITATATGKTSVTLSQSATGQSRTTEIPLGKTVYGGSLEVVSGTLTETYAGVVYDPDNIPTRMNTLIRNAGTHHNVTGQGSPYTFSSNLGQYPVVGCKVVGYYQTPGTPTPSSPKTFDYYNKVTIVTPDGELHSVSLGQTVYGGEYYPTTGRFYKYAFYSSYSGETLVGPWLSSMDTYTVGGTPTTGAQVLDFGKTTGFDVEAIPLIQVYGSNSIEASILYNSEMYLDAEISLDIEYYTGSLPSTVKVTGSSGLVVGGKTAYSLASAEVSQIDPATISLLKAASVTMSADTGNISAKLTSTLKYVTIAGAKFNAVNFGDTVVFDGINGALTVNGDNAAATTDFLHFPSLTPGPNVIDVQIGDVTVEYYPTYI